MEAAEEVTRAAVALYAVHGVEVFVETAVRSQAELEHVRKLLELNLDLEGGDAMPAGAMPAGSVRASAADQAAAARLSSVTPLATPAGSSASGTPSPPSPARSALIVLVRLQLVG